MAERFARKVSWRPVPAFVVALLAAFALIAGLSVALGALVTDVLLDSGGVQSWDEGVVEDIVDHRSNLLDTVAEVGAYVGSYVLVGLAVLVALILAFRREWRAAAFAAFLPFVESGIYRITSYVDPRMRPSVPRLEDLPADASYPSGHAGASVAVYIGLTLLLSSRVQSRGWRLLIWIVALAIPLFVALSRMYQGMHHPIDLGAGFLVGFATICIVAFACRAAGAAAEHRAPAEVTHDTDPEATGPRTSDGLPPPPPDRQPPPPPPGKAQQLAGSSPPPPPDAQTSSSAVGSGSVSDQAGESLAAAQRQGDRVNRSKGFERFARLGLIARGVVYGLVGVLAFGLAAGLGGATTSQQGALREIAQQPFGKVLLALTALGLAGYASWRLLRAAIGHGTEEDDSTFDRIGGLVSGIGYALLCATAVQILVGANSGGGGTSQTTGGVLAWTGGVWIVGAAGVFTMGEGLDQIYKGLSKKFLEHSKTAEMSQSVKKLFTRLGVVGHLARAVVFLLIGYFLLRAAIDYDPSAAITLDGALTKVAQVTYGKALLGVVSAGLIAFGAFSIMDARYRKV